MVLMHVPIGLYNLPVPLAGIVAAAVVVVAASFALIYVAPPKIAGDDEAGGGALPRWLPWLATAAAAAFYLYVVAIAILGRQGLAALNGASLAFWVFTIPLLPLAHCLMGGIYQAANPFAAAARLLSGGRRVVNADAVLRRLGYWPAVIMLFLLVMGESVSEVVQNPAVLGYAAILYGVVQVCLGILLGDEWYHGGDVFQALTSLASTVAPIAVRRDADGGVRLHRGFNPARFLPPGGGRQALITLWLAGVLADGVRATPIWTRLVVPHTQTFFESLGRVGGVDLGDATEITLEIVLTWIAFGLFFWLFVVVASVLSAWRAPEPGQDPFDRERLTRLATIVSPSLIPIAVAYLLAHNLTQLLVIGPLIVTARDAEAGQLGLLVQQQIHHLNPSWVWWVQVTAIVLGHVVAVVMAHARLAHGLESSPALAAKSARKPAPHATRAPEVRHGMGGEARAAVLLADLGWLSAMLIYTATSLWILAMPITASR